MKRPQFFLEADAGGGAGGAAGAGAAAGGTLLAGAGAAGGGSSQQPPAAAAAAYSWADESGKFSPDWLEKLPEDLRGDSTLRTIQDLPTMAKVLRDTKRMVGTKLEMPAHDAPPEQIANWRKVTGAPEKPEGYLGDAKTLKPENIPAELWDAESEKGFLAIAHKYGLPPAAVKEIAAFDAQRLEKALGKSGEAEVASVNAERASLQSEWGADYEKNINIAARAAVTLGLKTDDPMFTNAKYVKAMHRMAALMSEDKLVKGDASTAMGGSINERISDIQNPQSQSHLARAYRGELGPQEVEAAQKQLHALFAARDTK